MTRTTHALLKTVCFTGLLLAAVTTTAVRASADSPAASPGKRPNVLFLLADDHRPDTIGALGNKVIKTPNIDQLVKSGFVFNNAYCMGSYSRAVCLPSRTMILTGKNVVPGSKRLFRYGKPTNWGDMSVPIFPRWMKKAGYATMHSGKWDNNPTPYTEQFEVNLCVSRSKTSSQKNADNVIEFLRKHKDGRPFFVYVGFSKPHFPFGAPAEYMAMYEAEGVPLPPNFQPMPSWNTGANMVGILDETLLPWPRPPDGVRGMLAKYYGTISYLDSQVGRILDVLEEMGLAENTIVIYASDHGWALGGHGLLGKQNLYEDSMGAPLIFSGPGVPKKKSSNALAYLHDIFPTVCELTGVDVPKNIHSKSLAPIIRGDARKVRDSLYTYFASTERTVRDDRWKLIRYPKTNVSQLYDLQNDPHETKNLAVDPAHAEKVQQMTELLKQWQTKLGDELPLTADNPEDPLFDLEKQRREWEEEKKRRKAFAEKRKKEAKKKGN